MPKSDKVILRCRYAIKANEYVIHPVVIRDVDNVVTASPIGTLIMDEETFNLFRGMVAGKPEFEFFDIAAPGVSR